MAIRSPKGIKMETNLTLLGRNLLVEPIIESDKQNEAGLYTGLAEVSPLMKGKILKLGYDIVHAMAVPDFELLEGDIVYFSKYASQPSEFDALKGVVISDHDIVAVER
jgi:co-chaperonin GroES (HSP10)